MPENVNYAVKSSLLLSFLESLPAVSAKLKASVTVDRKFEDVVKSAQGAAVLVLVYPFVCELHELTRICFSFAQIGVIRGFEAGSVPN